MTGTNHTLAGAIIAILVPAPFVPIVAFLSHFVLDAVPHFGNKSWMPTRENRVISRKFMILLCIDAVLCFAALFFSWWLFPNKWLIITIGTFFAAGPDFLWLFDGRWKNKYTEAFFNFATKIQWAEWPWGWVLEIIYAAAFTTIIVSLAR